MTIINGTNLNDRNPPGASLSEQIAARTGNNTYAIASAINYTLSINAEDLLSVSLASIKAIGKEQAHHLTSDAAAHALKVSAGAMAMTGGAGNEVNETASAADSLSTALTQTALLAAAASPLRSLSLSALSGSLGLKINGEAAGAAPGDGLGAAVGLVGDLNGDGLADVAFGAPRADPGSAINETVNSGATYVTFGARNISSLANGLAGFDSGLINGTNGLILEGGASSAVNAFASGTRVGGNGDFNGDGFDELLISANPPSALGQPLAYLFNGASTVASSNRLAVTAINGTQGATFHGNSAHPGYSLATASAGDLNGDGRDDLIFGEFNDVTGSLNEQGTGYVVFGNTTSKLNGLGALSSNPGVLKLTHATTGDLGGAVASAGDLNGDGYADLVIGAPQFGTNNAGRAFVLFGKAGMAGGSFDLATLNGSNGFAMTNSFVVGMQSGISVSSAGDINGDGIGDLLVGGFESSGMVGAAYVIYGKTTAFAASIDLNTLNGTNGGFRISGPATGLATKFGASVAAAGDVNGDGFGDVVIGDPGQSDAYILFGNTSAVMASRMTTNPPFLPAGKYMFVDTAGSNLNGTNGVALLGSGGLTGESVSGAGDTNGDGYDDVFVGASAQSNATADLGPVGGANTPGQGYIVFGRNFASGSISTPLVPFSSASHATALANGEAIVGASGNNSLSSGAFNNVTMHGGAGNDSFAINGSEFRVDGGHGLDTLLLSRANTTLNFSAVTNGARESSYSDIESIDLRGATNGGVTLQLRDLLNLTGSGLQAGDTHGLRIIGDGNDHVTAAIGQGAGLSWHSIASNVSFADVAGHTFTHYTVSGLSSPASLFIDNAIGSHVIA